MKKIYSTIIVTLILIIGGFGFCFGEDNSDYDETKSSINSYIDDQLEKITKENSYLIFINNSFSCFCWRTEVF